MRGWKWLAPAVLVLVVVTAVPIGRIVWTSLHRSNLTAPDEVEFVGIDNLLSVVSSRQWWLAVAVTLVVVTAVVTIQVVLGCMFAAAINRVTRVWPVARVVALLPLAVLSVVGVVLWHDAATTGFVFQWFGEPSPLVAVTISEIWRGTGLVIVVVALALARVPSTLMASALADGATGLQRWRRVILPSIAPALAAIVTFRVLDTLRVLDGPLLVDPLLVDDGDTTLRTAPVLMWNTQFSAFELGLGAAMSVVLLVVAVALTAALVPAFRVRRGL
ncbi:carbohydrate ABC transporter permease [Aeromicrobium sp. CF3.5]|uniref:carbohydrate ABC transporter permease n=1 Tax=Aeromicrobium sp. CF3.5 TaxID=3373078 RepID=UPI003EE78658